MAGVDFLDSSLDDPSPPSSAAGNVGNGVPTISRCFAPMTPRPVPRVPAERDVREIAFRTVVLEKDVAA